MDNTTNERLIDKHNANYDVDNFNDDLEQALKGGEDLDELLGYCEIDITKLSDPSDISYVSPSVMSRDMESFYDPYAPKDIVLLDSLKENITGSAEEGYELNGVSISNEQYDRIMDLSDRFSQLEDKVNAELEKREAEKQPVVVEDTKESIEAYTPLEKDSEEYRNNTDFDFMCKVLGVDDNNPKIEIYDRVDKSIDHNFDVRIVKGVADQNLPLVVGTYTNRDDMPVHFIGEISPITGKDDEVVYKTNKEDGSVIKDRNGEGIPVGYTIKPIWFDEDKVDFKYSSQLSISNRDYKNIIPSIRDINNGEFTKDQINFKIESFNSVADVIIEKADEYSDVVRNSSQMSADARDISKSIDVAINSTLAEIKSDLSALDKDSNNDSIKESIVEKTSLVDTLTKLKTEFDELGNAYQKIDNVFSGDIFLQAYEVDFKTSDDNSIAKEFCTGAVSGPEAVTEIDVLVGKNGIAEGAIAASERMRGISNTVYEVQDKYEKLIEVYKAETTLPSGDTISLETIVLQKVESAINEYNDLIKDNKNGFFSENNTEAKDRCKLEMIDGGVIKNNATDRGIRASDLYVDHRTGGIEEENRVGFEGSLDISKVCYTKEISSNNKTDAVKIDIDTTKGLANFISADYKLTSDFIKNEVENGSTKEEAIAKVDNIKSEVGWDKLNDDNVSIEEKASIIKAYEGALSGKEEISVRDITVGNVVKDEISIRQQIKNLAKSGYDSVTKFKTRQYAQLGSQLAHGDVLILLSNIAQSFTGLIADMPKGEYVDKDGVKRVIKYSMGDVFLTTYQIMMSSPTAIANAIIFRAVYFVCDRTVDIAIRNLMSDDVPKIVDVETTTKEVELIDTDPVDALPSDDTVDADDDTLDIPEPNSDDTIDVSENNNENDATIEDAVNEEVGTKEIDTEEDIITDTDIDTDKEDSSNNDNIDTADNENNDATDDDISDDGIAEEEDIFYDDEEDIFEEDKDQEYIIDDIDEELDSDYLETYSDEEEIEVIADETDPDVDNEEDEKNDTDNEAEDKADNDTAEDEAKDTVSDNEDDDTNDDVENNNEDDVIKDEDELEGEQAIDNETEEMLSDNEALDTGLENNDVDNENTTEIEENNDNIDKLSDEELKGKLDAINDELDKVYDGTALADETDIASIISESSDIKEEIEESISNSISEKLSDAMGTEDIEEVINNTASIMTMIDEVDGDLASDIFADVTSNTDGKWKNEKEETEYSVAMAEAFAYHKSVNDIDTDTDDYVLSFKIGDTQYDIGVALNEDSDTGYDYIMNKDGEEVTISPDSLNEIENTMADKMIEILDSPLVNRTEDMCNDVVASYIDKIDDNSSAKDSIVEMLTSFQEALPTIFSATFEIAEFMQDPTNYLENKIESTLKNAIEDKAKEFIKDNTGIDIDNMIADLKADIMDSIKEGITDLFNNDSISNDDNSMYDVIRNNEDTSNNVVADTADGVSDVVSDAASDTASDVIAEEGAEAVEEAIESKIEESVAELVVL